jgi:hypothetical protein
LIVWIKVGEIICRFGYIDVPGICLIGDSRKKDFFDEIPFYENKSVLAWWATDSIAKWIGKSFTNIHWNQKKYYSFLHKKSFLVYSLRDKEGNVTGSKQFYPKQWDPR